MRDIRFLGSLRNLEFNESQASKQAKPIFNIFVLREFTDCNYTASIAFWRPTPSLADVNLPRSTNQPANLPIYVHRLQPNHHEL